ncbi:MAG: gamma-glutamyltransferase family protein [Pirellulaceae bacterium]
MPSLFVRASFCFLVSLLTCHPSVAQPYVRVERSDSGMVVSDSADASRVGAECLRQGGNAVDAAVATAFALAVTWPEAGNIGGGGFMLIRPADGESPVCVDYRETAPQSMHSTSFQRDDHTHSEKAVGVPGTVAGLALAHQQFGKLPWRELVLPAVRLARDGFAVDGFLADSINSVLAKPGNLDTQSFAELRRIYGKPDQTPWRAGDRIVLPELADTLSLIAEDPNAFYSGRLADLFVAQMQRGNGRITKADLQQYKAKIRPAVTGTYHGYQIIGAPPPSSGGTCLIEALNILENFDLDQRNRFDPQTVHLIAEAMRRAFADRARFLGDPDFTEIPAYLTSKAHARDLASSIDPVRATDSESLTPEIDLQPESPDTTHFSIVDADGMAVSNTYTLEASWGSRIVVRGAGYVLNNEMGTSIGFLAKRTGRDASEPSPILSREESECSVRNAQRWWNTTGT